MRETFEEIGISYITSYLRKSGYEVLLLGQSEDNIDYERIEEFKPNIVGMPMYDLSQKGGVELLKQFTKSCRIHCLELGELFQHTILRR